MDLTVRVRPQPLVLPPPNLYPMFPHKQFLSGMPPQETESLLGGVLPCVLVGSRDMCLVTTSLELQSQVGPNRHKQEDLLPGTYLI